ncbi:MAG: hypothetical protein F9K46_15965 [Anaerolineae bacterium]|nr:MAG: hypothetical protein F9K46_15965 [Anaerolineae bacterium]
MSNSQSDQLMAALQKHLYTTQADIEANRRGVISETQIARIHGQLRSAWLVLGCLMFALLGPFLLFSLLLGWQIFLFVLIVGLLIASVSGWFTTKQIQRQYQLINDELLRGEIAHVEGVLERKVEGRRMGQYVGIGSEFFDVPKGLLEAIPEGETAVIYYLPQSKQLLSLELGSTGEEDTVED